MKKRAKPQVDRWKGGREGEGGEITIGFGFNVLCNCNATAARADSAKDVFEAEGGSAAAAAGGEMHKKLEFEMSKWTQTPTKRFLISPVKKMPMRRTEDHFDQNPRFEGKEK